MDFGTESMDTVTFDPLTFEFEDPMFDAGIEFVDAGGAVPFAPLSKSCMLMRPLVRRGEGPRRTGGLIRRAQSSHPDDIHFSVSKTYSRFPR